jgi:uncharacterized membrane protein HdeD (DUF308 family)
MFGMSNPSVRLPTWYRVVTIVVGLISIGLAFVVLLDPGLALLTLVFLLGFALLVIGIDRIIAGITGHPYGWAPLSASHVGPGAPGSGQEPPAGPH